MYLAAPDCKILAKLVINKSASHSINSETRAGYGTSKTLNQKCEPPNGFFWYSFCTQKNRVIPQIMKSAGPKVIS